MSNIQHVGFEFNMKARVKALLCVADLEPTEFEGTFNSLMQEAHTEAMLYGSCNIRIIELITPTEKELKC